MKKPLMVTIVLAVVILGAGLAYVLVQDNTKKSDATTNQTAASSEGSATGNSSDTTTETQSNLTIVFTNDGFDKETYNVKAGSVVTVKNESTMSVEFSSGSHPTHLEDPEINMEELAPGESGTFTPTIKGSHDFHDHIHDEYTGTLVVE